MEPFMALILLINKSIINNVRKKLIKLSLANIFWMAVFLFLSFNSQYQLAWAAFCPPGDLIWPCKCANYFNLIECSNITNEDNLRQIFIRLQMEHQKQRNKKLIYDEIKLVQTNLEQIGSIDDIFQGIAFRRISINRNNNLKRLLPKGFSNPFLSRITTEILIEDNPQLGANVDDNMALFETINSFSSLNTLHLTDNGIRQIPKYAFNKTQPVLRELFLTDNRIEQVDDYAFSGLRLVELINLDGNQISVLSEKCLELANDTNKLLRIFIRSNRLQTNSFVPGMFANLRRRTYLNLSVNNITSLPQDVFQSFFKRNSIMSVAKNPLKCDCDFKWLLDLGVLYNSTNKDKNYQLKDYQCFGVWDQESNNVDPNNDNEQIIINEVDHSDFEHCPESPIEHQYTNCISMANNPEQELSCLNLRSNSNFHYNHFSLWLFLFILFNLIL